MFRCEWCGAIFEHPAEHVYTENLDGENGWMTWHMAVCPSCGEEQISEIKNNESEDEDADL